MPVRWRKIYYKKTEEEFGRRKKEQEKQQGILNFTDKGSPISKPDIKKPTYTSKAAKK